MSLVRTAARISAVMALAGGFRSPYPTIAQDRVYDTRFDPQQIIDTTEVMPILSVCTDDDHGSSLSANNGGPPFEQTVTLAIDISIGMVGTIDDQPQFNLMPQTEPELEAMLDLFEHQVKRTFIDPLNPWSAEFNKAVRRMTDWTSSRYVERDTNIRLAARRMTTSCMLALEELIEMADGSPAAVPAPLGPLLGRIITDDGPFAPSATAMRDLLLGGGASQPVTLPRLREIRFIEARQAEKNDAGTPRGPRPDGVASVTPTPET